MVAELFMCRLLPVRTYIRLMAYYAVEQHRKDTELMIDSRDILELHPALARGARELIVRMGAAGFGAVGISSTYRCFERQNQLFEQGRTTPGQIVTNARGGQSMHNYRLAFDIFQNIRGQEWNNPRFFETGGRMWQEMGGEWGGSWTTFVDRVHMQYTGGLTLAQLQRGLVLPQNHRMPWEKDIEKSDEEEMEVRFNKVEELPDWAVATVEKLLRKGHLKGTGSNLDLSMDMLRILVVNDRAGVFG